MLTKDNHFDLSWHFPDGRKNAFASISLLIILLLLYSNSFHCDWLFDDQQNILNNKNIRINHLDLEELKSTFFFEGKFSRPVSYLSFALNYWCGGTDVFGYHVVNFIIHCLTAVFLFLFIHNTLQRSLLKEEYARNAYSIALLSTLFWAISPLQVLAVTYIVQRMASMAGLFYVMSMYFYLKARTAEGNAKSIFFFITCALTAFLALGSKENAAMLPVSLFFYDLLLIQGVSKKTLLKNAKLIALPLFAVLLTAPVYADPSTLLSGYGSRPFTLSERLLTEPRIMIYYVSLLLYPDNSRLTMLHDFDLSHSLFDPLTTLPAILSIIFLTSSAVLMARKKPLLSYCILFFFLNHLIEGSFIPLELIYEHRNYIPSLLFFVPPAIIMVNVLDYFSYRRSIQFLTVFMVVFLMVEQGHTVHQRNEILATGKQLWMDNIRKAPELGRPYNNLSNIMYREGRYDTFLNLISRALKTRAEKHANLVEPLIYIKNIGDYYLNVEENAEAALMYYRKAELSYRPEFGNDLKAELYGRMAMASILKGETKQAIEYSRQAIQYFPEYAPFYGTLAWSYLKNGDIEKAQEAAEKAVILDGDYSVSHAIIGEACLIKHQYASAERAWRRYAQANPCDLNAAIALIEIGHVRHNESLVAESIGRLLCLGRPRHLAQWIRNAREWRSNKTIHKVSDKSLTIIRRHLNELGEKTLACVD